MSSVTKVHSQRLTATGLYCFRSKIMATRRPFSEWNFFLLVGDVVVGLKLLARSLTLAARLARPLHLFSIVSLSLYGAISRAWRLPRTEHLARLWRAHPWRRGASLNAQPKNSLLDKRNGKIESRISFVSCLLTIFLEVSKFSIHLDPPQFHFFYTFVH